MLKKSEIIRTGLLTALITFAAIAAVAVAAGPGTGITMPAHAMTSANIGGHGGVNDWRPAGTVRQVD
jgi:hypothetical protein